MNVQVAELGFSIVLDKGWVELQDMMPHPTTGISVDAAVVNAARTSYLSLSKGEEKDAALINYLMEHNHTSPFEQAVFKFRVYAPMVVYWQWVRHRTFHYQSVNSQSGRYMEFEEEAMYLPETWRRQAVKNKQASDGVIATVDTEEVYKALEEHQKRSFELYQKALEKGVAREQARLFLPAFCMYYTWVISVDMHNLFHFLKLRMADEAQWEIRQYANAMYEMVKMQAPVSCAAFERYVLKHA